MLNASMNKAPFPAIIISEISKRDKENNSPDCLRKSKCPKLSSSPASYDESLKFLSQSLEQICGRGSNSSLTSLGLRESLKSPVVVSARPQSFHLATSVAQIVKGTPTKGNYIRRDSDGTLLLKIRHNETHEKLEQSLSKICASSSAGSSSTIQKRISDAQENLKSKFRIKVDLTNQELDLNNLYITIDQQRTLTITHIIQSGNSNISKSSTKDLHTCKVPEGIILDKILCSYQEGPSLYMRPSCTSVTEFSNTNLRHIPLIYTNEETQQFTITLRLPLEVSLDTVEIKRIDEKLVIRAFGFKLNDSNGRISQMESSMSFQIELPEDSDGRTLSAKIFTSRILVIEGKLLPTFRRMTCKF